MIAALAFSTLATGLLQICLPLELRQLRASPESIGLTLSMFGLGMFAFEWLWGVVADHVGYRIPLIASQLLYATFIVLLSQAGSVLLIAASYFLASGMMVAVGPIARSYLGTALHARLRATGLALLASQWVMAQALGAGAGGALIDRFPIHPVILAGALLPVISAILVGVVFRKYTLVDHRRRDGLDRGIDAAPPSRLLHGALRRVREHRRHRGSDHRRPGLGRSRNQRRLLRLRHRRRDCGGCGGPDGRAAPNVDYAPGRCIGPRFGEPSMIRNLIGPDWRPPADGAASLPVFNPATGEVIEQVPLSGERDVDAAVAAATSAYSTWSRTPLMERVRLMFRYKAVLEEHFEDLASIITLHHGKTLDESRGEVRRGIEVVDFACGAPTLLQGRTLRDVSGGVDQDLYRYPVGVCAGIPPFNFPVMIPLWMFPLAAVAGNTFILKPSERTPLGGARLAELFLEAGFPPGVLNVIHGAAGTVDALLEHPGISAISFVGSAPVARHVYTQAAANSKRVQALGGAKNHIVVMPDADPALVIPAILNSAFGNAGERCLAGSVAVAVGDAGQHFLEALCEQTRQLVVGPGDQPGVDVGPLIRAEHRDRVAHY